MMEIVRTALFTHRGGEQGGEAAHLPQGVEYQKCILAVFCARMIGIKPDREQFGIQVSFEITCDESRQVIKLGGAMVL
jgi:hypothetical protein